MPYCRLMQGWCSLYDDWATSTLPGSWVCCHDDQCAVRHCGLQPVLLMIHKVLQEGQQKLLYLTWEVFWLSHHCHSWPVSIHQCYLVCCAVHSSLILNHIYIIMQFCTFSVGLPRWLSGLRHSAHRPERSAGGVGFNPGSAGRFRVQISGAHALRLISRAGKEGSTVSIICDRWLILS